MADIIKFPINASQSGANFRGCRLISDVVSGRTVRFGLPGARVSGGTTVAIEFRGEPSSENGIEGRVLCRMFVTIEELKRVADMLVAETAKIESE